MLLLSKQMCNAKIERNFSTFVGEWSLAASCLRNRSQQQMIFFHLFGKYLSAYCVLRKEKWRGLGRQGIHLPGAQREWGFRLPALLTPPFPPLCCLGAQCRSLAASTVNVAVSTVNLQVEKLLGLYSFRYTGVHGGVCELSQEERKAQL